MAANGFTCSMCHQYTSSSIHAVLRHIGSVHAHQANFRVVCGIQECPRTYTNYYSFRKHLRRKHIILEDVSQTDSFEYPLYDQETDVSESEALQPYIDPDELLKRNVTLFILKTKEVRHVSQLALNDLIGDMSSMVQQTVDIMASKISSVLTAHGTSVQDIDGLEEIFQDEKLRNPFKGLESSYLQRKVYNLLGLVVSIIALLYKLNKTGTS